MPKNVSLTDSLWKLQDAINSDAENKGWYATLAFSRSGVALEVERGSERLVLATADAGDKTGSADGYAAALVTAANSYSRRAFTEYASRVTA